MRGRAFLAGTVSSLHPYGRSAWRSGLARAETLPLSQRRAKVSDIVILYNSKDSAETPAAQELQKFLSRLSSAAPALFEGASHSPVNPAGTRFLVGRTRLVEELLSTGKIEEPAAKHSE